MNSKNYSKLIKNYKIEKYKRDRYNKNVYIETYKHITLDNLNKLRNKETKIYDYYYMQEFLKTYNNKYKYLFITYTINTKEHKIHNTTYTNENETIQNNQKQNEIFNDTFKYFNKIKSNNKIKSKYIKVVELTKNNNIHIHILYKVIEEDIKKFIKLKKDLHKKLNGRIEIKTNIDIKDIEKYKIEEYKNKKIIIDVEEDIKETYKKGNYIYIDTIKEQNNTNIFAAYLFKYINKNKKTLEHIILNELKIKKITYNQTKQKYITIINEEIEEKKLTKENYIRIVSIFHNKIKINKINDNKRRLKQKEFKTILKETKINETNILIVINRLLENDKITIENDKMIYTTNNNEKIILKTIYNIYEKLDLNEIEELEDKEFIEDLIYIENNIKTKENNYLYFEMINKYFKLNMNYRKIQLEIQEEERQRKENYLKQYEKLLYEEKSLTLDSKENKYYDNIF